MISQSTQSMQLGLIQGGSLSGACFTRKVSFPLKRLPSRTTTVNLIGRQPMREVSLPSTGSGSRSLVWYDPGLWVWGGENFELSFKVWMCGGNSVWVPCSRVSHVYRGHSCSSCHSGTLGNKFGGVPTTLRNYKRVIEVWMDPEYREFFYTREPLARLIDHGDISAQLKMKEDMKCKSFD